MKRNIIRKAIRRVIKPTRSTIIWNTNPTTEREKVELLNILSNELAATDEMRLAYAEAGMAYEDLVQAFENVQVAFNKLHPDVQDVFIGMGVSEKGTQIQEMNTRHKYIITTLEKIDDHYDALSDLIDGLT